MNNRSPQQVAADYVRSQYNSFWANPAWNVPVPNPLPLGWIDLSNIPAHPRHARSVKRMIFEAQHPELFTFEEKQVTFALVPTPFRIPPGVNPASIIAPAPEHRTDDLIVRIPKLRPADPAAIPQAAQVLTQLGIPVAQPAVPIVQTAVRAVQRVASIAQPALVVQQIHDTQPTVSAVQQVITAARPVAPAAQTLNAIKKFDASMLGNASGRGMGSERQFQKKLKEMEAAVTPSSGLQQKDSESLNQDQRTSKKSSNKTRKRSRSQLFNQDEQPSIASSSKTRKKPKVAREESFTQSQQLGQAVEDEQPSNQISRDSLTETQQLVQASGNGERPYASPYGPVEPMDPTTLYGLFLKDQGSKSTEKPEDEEGSETKSSDGSQGRKEKSTAWALQETLILEKILKAIRAEEEAKGIPKEEKKRFDGFYEEASKRLAKDYGIHRTWAAIKNHWSRKGRKLTGFDERLLQNPDMLETSVQKPKAKK